MPAQFTILIDGDCPLCRHEAALLRRLDRGRGRLAFIDISDAAFNPASLGVSMSDVMGTIHGVLPDGRLVTGLDVFRRAYGAVGWGWLWAPTGWPVVRPLADRVYRWFARRRLALTGRRMECGAGTCRVVARRPRAGTAA